MLNTARQLGSVIGVAVFGSLIANSETFVPHDVLIVSTVLLLTDGLAVLAFVRGQRG